MPTTMTILDTVTVGNISNSSTSSVTADNYLNASPTVAAAKTGQLTTRTSDTVGTLTMSGGHGITTGARLDLYWTGGQRRGITVGTVATNSVPFTLGDGDNLPVNLTSITAMVPNEEVFIVDGDNVTALELFSDQYGTIVLAEADDTEIAYKVLGGQSQSADRTYCWTAGRDPVNPLASGDITKVYFSHSVSTASANMRCQALYD